MRFDGYDIMLIKISVSQDKHFAMSDHHPLVAGKLLDGRESYIFRLITENGLAYQGSGPTPKKAHFLQRSDKQVFTFIAPSPSDRLYIRVLRYDPDAYMQCKYYADKVQRGEIGMNSTGPFSWKFFRNLSVGSDQL